MKRIIIELQPSLDPRQGEQVSWRAEGFGDSLVDVLQVLTTLASNCVTQMVAKRDEAVARAAAMRLPGRNGKMQ